MATDVLMYNFVNEDKLIKVRVVLMNARSQATSRVLPINLRL